MSGNKNHGSRVRRGLHGVAALMLAMASVVLGTSVAQAGTGDRDRDHRHHPRDRVDLRRGAVFAMSNFSTGNEVVAYSRRADGTLREVGRYPTGGTGSGSFEDSANSVVLGSWRGEAAPNNLIGRGKLLFVTNAGSNTISVFRVHRSRLELVDVQDSGGEKPVSLTVNRGRLYVLNSGEIFDGLVDEEGNFVGNCTHGHRPSITGFRIWRYGELSPIPHSTRQLSADPISGCAQISFTPSGRTLVVTERRARPAELQQADDDEGVIVTFAMNWNGTPGRKQIHDATGQGPFGFTFTRDGELLTTEQFDAAEDLGAGASYRFGRNGDLVPTSPSLFNGGTDTCWIVVTDNQRLAFASSAFGDARISTYWIDRRGGMHLLDPVSTSATDDAKNDGVEVFATDLSLDRRSKHLYLLNSYEGTIDAFKVHRNGSLTPVQKVTAFELDPNANLAAPMGLAAS